MKSTWIVENIIFAVVTYWIFAFIFWDIYWVADRSYSFFRFIYLLICFTKPFVWSFVEEVTIVVEVQDENEKAKTDHWC